MRGRAGGTGAGHRDRARRARGAHAPHDARLDHRARPRLSWEAATGAIAHYELELDRRCGLGALAACDFVRAELTLRSMAPWWQPEALPPGRWAWRVRACQDGGCSPWSRPRRFALGAVSADVDGDGYSDVIAGAPLLDLGGHDRGTALLVLGGPPGAEPRYQRLDEPAGADDAELGAAVAIVGDVDGDGLDDVVVGAPGTDEGRGRAYLYLGAPGGVRGPVLVIDDPHGRAGDAFGATIVGAGDVDGDGFADVAIGAPTADGTAAGELDRGKVLVLRGGPTGLAGTDAWLLLAGEPRPFDGFGTALSAGDLDGDGFGDIVVGAAGIDRSDADLGVDRGAVYVYAGGRDGPSRGPSVRLEAPSPVDHDRFGWAVSASGDLDGDGLHDLAVGAPSRDDAALDGGLVYIFPGARGGVATVPRHTVGGQQAEALRRLGTAVAIVGDVDGDGLDDLAIGTSGDRGGVAVIFRGGREGPDARPLAVLRDGSAIAPDDHEATARYTSFGDSVAGAGDVDGDGRADVVVGAASAPLGNDALAVRGGAVLVFRTIAAALPAAPLRIDGPDEEAQLGRTVAGAMRRAHVIAVLLVLGGCGGGGEQPVDAIVTGPPPDAGAAADALSCQAPARCSGCDQALPCPTAAVGKVSVCGRLVDVASDAPLRAASPALRGCEDPRAAQDGPCALRISFHDALDYAGDPGGAATLPVDDLHIDDCGRFSARNISRPQLGYLALVVDDQPERSDARAATRLGHGGGQRPGSQPGAGLQPRPGDRRGVDRAGQPAGRHVHRARRAAGDLPRRRRRAGRWRRAHRVGRAAARRVLLRRPRRCAHHDRASAGRHRHQRQRAAARLRARGARRRGRRARGLRVAAPARRRHPRRGHGAALLPRMRAVTEARGARHRSGRRARRGRLARGTGPRCFAPLSPARRATRRAGG